jgi:hypothetical protein
VITFEMPRSRLQLGPNPGLTTAPDLYPLHDADTKLPERFHAIRESTTVRSETRSWIRGMQGMVK